MEPAVEREAPTVITAAQLLLVPRPVNDEGCRDACNVRERMKGVLRVACEKQRLVERARQEGEGKDLAGDLHDIVVRRVLPRPREHAVTLRAEEYRIGIRTSRQRRALRISGSMMKEDSVRSDSFIDADAIERIRWSYPGRCHSLVPAPKPYLPTYPWRSQISHRSMDCVAYTTQTLDQSRGAFNVLRFVAGVFIVDAGRRRRRRRRHVVAAVEQRARSDLSPARSSIVLGS